MNVEIAAEAALFPEKEYKRNCRCSVDVIFASRSALSSVKDTALARETMQKKWFIFTRIKTRAETTY
jgi:hypothetical protein